MQRRWKALAAGLAAALALSVGAVPAAAGEGPGQSQASASARQAAKDKRQAARKMLRRVALKAAAEYLDLERKALKAELKEGQSLAQVATAQGKSVDGLKDAIRAAADAALDRMVAGNRLTQAQADKLLEKFEAKLDQFVNRTRKAKE